MQKQSRWYIAASDRERYDVGRLPPSCRIAEVLPGAILWVPALNTAKILSTGEAKKMAEAGEMDAMGGG